MCEDKLITLPNLSSSFVTHSQDINLNVALPDPFDKILQEISDMTDLEKISKILGRNLCTAEPQSSKACQEFLSRLCSHFYRLVPLYPARVLLDMLTKISQILLDSNEDETKSTETSITYLDNVTEAVTIQNYKNEIKELKKMVERMSKQLVKDNIPYLKVKKFSKDEDLDRKYKSLFLYKATKGQKMDCNKTFYKIVDSFRDPQKFLEMIHSVRFEYFNIGCDIYKFMISLNGNSNDVFNFWNKEVVSHVKKLKTKYFDIFLSLKEIKDLHNGLYVPPNFYQMSKESKEYLAYMKKRANTQKFLDQMLKMESLWCDIPSSPVPKKQIQRYVSPKKKITVRKGIKYSKK
ncbi:unnamed protein product [Moneuplotes crassus]|uniref:Uncharacterized protein n=1 Tax=Euplotes crassus TaxID=5936 RepID=A0AAD1UCI1_EUPCR|nr:unnamed protein product [Moneuplotes crassus]